MITMFQPDTRCMHHPDRDDDFQNQMASVYITATGSKPQNVVKCSPWTRQKSEMFDAKRGEVYYITAATFAPGQQGAFSIAVTGNGLALEPAPFATPTPKEEKIMAVNWDPYPCCAGCHNDIDGSYFQTALGPQCQGCAEGLPPPTKVRRPPAGSIPVVPSTPSPVVPPSPAKDQGGNPSGASDAAVPDGNADAVPSDPDPAASSKELQQGLLATVAALQADQVACVALGGAVLLGGLMLPLAHNLLIFYAGIKSFRAIQSPDPEDDKQ